MSFVEDTVVFLASFLLLLGIVCAVVYGPVLMLYGILHLFQ